MSEIVTAIKPGDTVWWVHDGFTITGANAAFYPSKVYKGTVQAITLCEYQGALYCNIFSPSFRRNRYPVVHYSKVFRSREEANEFAEQVDHNEDMVLPMCYGCHYSVKTKFTDLLEDE